MSVPPLKPNPTAPALPLPRAARVTVKVETLVPDTAVGLWTIASAPLVPVVTTPVNCASDQLQPKWAAPLSVIVTGPAEGAGPIARKSVRRHWPPP